MPKGNENESGTNDGEQNENEPESRSFRGEFDEARAARLIANLRDEVASLKEERNTLRDAEKEREDAEKSEVDRLKDALTAEQAKTKDAHRALYVSRAQAKHGLSDDEADEFLSGLDDEEKILARAERLAGLRGGSQEERGGEDDEDEESGEGAGLPSKPKPNLKPGSGSDEGGDIDEDALFNGAREARGY